MGVNLMADTGIPDSALAYKRPVAPASTLAAPTVPDDVADPDQGKGGMEIAARGMSRRRLPTDPPPGPTGEE
jgi:hypothetical protein